MEVFIDRVHGLLSNLVYCKVSLLVQGGWNCMVFNVPSSPNYGSVIL